MPFPEEGKQAAHLQWMG